MLIAAATPCEAFVSAMKPSAPRRPSSSPSVMRNRIVFRKCSRRIARGTASLEDDDRKNRRQDQKHDRRDAVGGHWGILCNLIRIPSYAAHMRRHLFASLAVFLAATAAFAANLQGNFDRTFDVRPGTSFALDNTNGHITIRSWDQPRIQ